RAEPALAAPASSGGLCSRALLAPRASPVMPSHGHPPSQLRPSGASEGSGGTGSVPNPGSGAAASGASGVEVGGGAGDWTGGDTVLGVGALCAGALSALRALMAARRPSI